MRWRGRRQSSNIEDRRGSGGLPDRFPGGLGRGRGPVRIPIGRSLGGGGLSGIVVLIVLFLLLRACGVDPFEVLMQGDPGMSGGTLSEDRPLEDERAQFVAVVLAETEDVWSGIFEAEGETYEEPRLVLFQQQVGSACGFASAASGPFYCPGDRQVYIDLGFFDQLASRFDAAGDFAQAYVIAHEVGHHVQNLIGVLPRFNEMRQGMNEVEANQMSTRVELQADCFAGIWAHYTEQRGLLEAGDLEEALNAAHQIGDDTLQKRTQGYVVPESFNHGTSEQRARWFSNGYENGRLEDCDTFSGEI